MKYLRYAILSLVTFLSALVGILAGMWATIQIPGRFDLWIYVIIVLLISAGFAFGGYRLTRKVIR
jgi:uncharacterized protein YneF (UPF0154 family)